MSDGERAEPVEESGASGTTETTFFEGKRPWSKIKDQVLRSYLPAYLAKVARMKRDIILIDAFAGPGLFEDGTRGSPLLMCEAAERTVPGKYTAIFVNRKRAHHQRLKDALAGPISEGSVIPILGNAGDLLTEVNERLSDETVFLYLDPFGLRGCEHATLRPFLERDARYSTEVVVNLSIPTMHRLATRKAMAAGTHRSQQIEQFHSALSRVLGGDYWKETLWAASGSAEARARKTMDRYRNRIIGAGLRYSGSCPVREKTGSGLKYYITFFSRHPDAMLLMNDAMCGAYQLRMHEAATAGTLFEETEWADTRNQDALREIVLSSVTQKPGAKRRDLWIDIVGQHFMEFMEREFRESVRALVKSGRIEVRNKEGARLNDESRLYPKRVA